MPALENLDSRINSDDEWCAQFKENLEETKVIAEKIPIIHTMGNHISLTELIAEPPFQIPVTSDSIDCSTRKSEDLLELGRNVYFYAGRAYPDFGSISLAFSSKSESGHTGMIVYVTANFRNAVDDDLRFKKYIWYKMEEKDIWVTCISSMEMIELMDDWGKILLKKSTERLIDFFSTKDTTLRQEVENFTNLALCSAMNPMLRACIYLRHESALMFSDAPERVDTIFELFIKKEFPSWTWEIFKMRLCRFVEIIMARTTFHRTKKETSSTIDWAAAIGQAVAATLESKHIQTVNENEEVRLALLENIINSYKKESA
jgi:hypothetical protein